MPFHFSVRVSNELMATKAEMYTGSKSSERGDVEQKCMIAFSTESFDNMHQICNGCIKRVKEPMLIAH